MRVHGVHTRSVSLMCSFLRTHVLLPEWPQRLSLPVDALSVELGTKAVSGKQQQRHSWMGSFGATALQIARRVSPLVAGPSARFASQIPGGNTHVEQHRKSHHWLSSASPYLTNMAKRGLQWPRRLKECWCFQQRMPARAIGLMPPLRLCSVLQCRLFHVAAQVLSQAMFSGRVSRATVDNARL